MKKLLYLSLTLLIFISFGIMGVSGSIATSETQVKQPSLNETNTNTVIIDLFYDPSCESCQLVLPFITGYEDVPGIVVHYNNIAENKASYERFKQIQNNLDNSSIQIPLAIVRNQYLSGKEEIIDHLDSLIQNARRSVVTQDTQPGPGVSLGSDTDIGTDKILFFYDSACESCLKVIPLIQQYQQTHPDTDMGSYDISDPGNHSLLHQVKTRFPNADIKVPVVFVGKTILQGEVEITDSLNTTIESYEKSRQQTTDAAPHQLVKNPDSVSLPTPLPSNNLSSTINQDIKGIYFFYNPSCGSCQKVLPRIEEYAKNNPKIKIFFNDISSNRTNIDLFNSFRNRFPQESIHIPVVFIGDTLLQGEENITNNFNSTVENYQQNNSTTNLITKQTPLEPTAAINPVVLLIAAIGEGLNPCGLLVLALLLVSLMATGTRRMVLYVGIAYICAFFLVRLLSGFAIFSVIQIPGVANAFMIAAGCIAIIAGVLQIKDGILKEPKPLLSIPESKKGTISSYLKKASIPGGFIVGILVGIYGMACTAGIYIAILGMLYREPTYGFLYLVLYNLVVIIPLIVILLLVFFGLSPETVNSWRNERKSLLRLLIGIIMVLMGIIILIPMI